MNNTKLKLSHDEMVVLAAIADQELTGTEIYKEAKKADSRVTKDSLFGQLRLMEAKGLIYLNGIEGSSKTLSSDLYSPSIPTLSIAPEVLSLNSPPYSYESWRDLSE